MSTRYRPSRAAGPARPARRTAPHPPCYDRDPDLLFVQGAVQNEVAVICKECPIRVGCLAEALDNRIEFGIWGGMTERQRRVLLRQQPQVSDWAQQLAAESDADSDLGECPKPARRVPGSAAA